MAHRVLWVLRHAKAVADPPAGGEDFDRTLAPRGRRDATALAHLCAGTVLALPGVAAPELVLVSSAARTLATAELAVAELTPHPEIRPVPDFYGADPEEVLDHVRALADDIASVMVVGHNPTMHALAQGLISAEDPDGHDLAVRRGFPTCALGVFTFDVARWGGVGARTGRLAGLFTPPFGEV